MDISSFQADKVKSFVEKFFDSNVLPNLMEFIRIPNQSRDFDPEILTNGLQEKAAELIFNWVKAQNIKNMTTAEIIHEKEKTTPTLFFIIEGSVQNSGTALFYGHLDKQPPMLVGWKEGTGPTNPKIIGNKLYGRGGSDDGYSCFAAISIIKACQENQLDHPRIVIMIEGDEESIGLDIPKVLESKQNQIGNVDLVFVLDSACLNYNTLWLTSTLKGILSLKLTVQVLDEGVHSGSASGVVPSSFRILRQLLDRIDSPETGEVNQLFQSDIPPYIYEQYKKCVDTVGGDYILSSYPWFENTQPTLTNPFQAFLNRAWRPQLSVIGIDGIPSTLIAGNVLRPYTQVKLSIRLPPNLDAKVAADNLYKLLTKDPPNNATIKVEMGEAGNGFFLRDTANFLKKSLKSSSLNYFGKEEQYLAVGGSIPIVDLFYKYYPKAQFIITGVGGPDCNAHGPNESLDLPFTKKLICCMTQICSEMAQHFKK